ncbi:hypothetical protein [Advenella sp. FME57]|uniref:hypothetical protein n=1 Tax=Advenella sp. FME57 TaxID=2742604 RepID=UPI001866D2DB|nr:hypothetical protein [Advenella sp. FME57]
MNIDTLVTVVDAAVSLFNVATDKSRPRFIRAISTIGATFFWTALLIFSATAVAVFIYHLIAQ